MSFSFFKTFNKDTSPKTLYDLCSILIGKPSIYIEDGLLNQRVLLNYFLFFNNNFSNEKHSDCSNSLVITSLENSVFNNSFVNKYKNEIYNLETNNKELCIIKELCNPFYESPQKRNISNNITKALHRDTKSYTISKAIDSIFTNIDFEKLCIHIDNIINKHNIPEHEALSYIDFLYRKITLNDDKDIYPYKKQYTSPCQKLSLMIVYSLIKTVSVKEYFGNMGDKSEELPLIENGIEISNSDFFIYSKNYFYEYISTHSINIKKDLLPSCSLEGFFFDSLFDILSNEQFEKTNFILSAEGGSGKSYSLINLWEKLVENTNDGIHKIIPIYIPANSLDKEADYPLSRYILNHYFNGADSFNMDLSSFIDFFPDYIHQTKFNFLFIIDGYNEESVVRQNINNEFNIYNEYKNTTFIVALRHLSYEYRNIFQNFREIKLNKLDRETIRTYLDTNNIAYGRRRDLSLLGNPLLLTLFIETHTNYRINPTDLNNGQIINTWINKQISKITDLNIYFYIDFVIPLLTTYLYINSEDTMSFAQKDIITQYQIIVSDIQNNNLKDLLILQYRINELTYNIKLLSESLELLEKNFALIYRNDTLKCYTWNNECYKDFFISKGFYYLREYFSDDYSDKILLFLDTKYDYPFNIRDQKYSSLSVAEYLLDLIGEKELQKDNSNEMITLIRNTIFSHDEMGDTDKVLYFSNLFITKAKSEKNPDNYLMASTASGIVASMLHINNVQERTDIDKIMDGAKYLLDLAKSCLFQITNFLVDTKSLTDEQIITLNPEELLHYFETNISTLSIKQENIETILLSARIYGNYGVYWLINYFISNDTQYLIKAYRMHITSGLIKYSLYKYSNDRRVIEALAASYGNFGTTMYYLKNYDLSNKYYELAIKQYSKVNQTIAIAKMQSRITRNKICVLNKDNFEIFYQDIVNQLLSYFNLFDNYYLLVEIDKLCITYKSLVDKVYSNRFHPNIFEKELTYNLANKIDEIYEKYYISKDNYLDMKTYTQKYIR